MIKKMIKKWKNDKKKKEKNPRKIGIFHFLENCNFPRFFFIYFSFVYHVFSFFLSFFIILYHFSSIPPLEAKKIKKMIKTRKKLEENCNFPFLAKFLHHWKQKWWKMIKNEKNKIKKWKQKLEENCNFSFFGKLQFSLFFSFFYFFHFFLSFFHCLIIFLSFFINSTTGSKNDKNMI